MVLRSLEVGPVAENCYLVGDEATGKCLIIDPGWEGSRLIDWITHSGFSPLGIYNTHGHPDHIGAVVAVQKHFHLSFWMHQADVPIMDSLPSFAAYMGESPAPDIPAVDHFLQDGDTFSCGTLTFTVLHTPGHTPGGLCFYESSQKILLAGDTLFAGSIGRTDLPGGSHPQLLASIHQRLMTLPDEVAAYPGHGPRTTIGRERTSNPFLLTHQR